MLVASQAAATAAAAAEWATNGLGASECELEA